MLVLRGPLLTMSATLLIKLGSHLMPHWEKGVDPSHRQRCGAQYWLIEVELISLRPNTLDALQTNRVFIAA